MIKGSQLVGRVVIDMEAAERLGRIKEIIVQRDGERQSAQRVDCAVDAPRHWRGRAYHAIRQARQRRRIDRSRQRSTLAREAESVEPAHYAFAAQLSCWPNRPRLVAQRAEP